jgi:poly-gamma-glutamate synthesis protein (capsule biosynthesis protein)
MRKKRKLKKITIFLLLLIVIGLTGIVIVNLKEKNNKQIEPEIIEPQKEEYELKLIMAGDALIHDRLYNDAYKDGEYDFKPYLKLIKEKVNGYDLAYYNQETILGGTSIGLSTYPSFNSPQELGDAMIDAGFNLVSLATNHTLDRGEKAILLSRDYWDNHKDVYAFGSYKSSEQKKELESQVFEKNHIKYGILNYDYGTNGIPVPSGKDYLINLWTDLADNDSYNEKVKEDINTLRDQVDVLIVAMHWGIEYTHTPTDLVKRTAKFLADNGVDIIIGTHPHVIEPVEWIDDTIVFYSLGNFISAQNSESCTNYKCNIGLLSNLTITKTIDGDDVTIKIDNIENDLIYTYHKNYHDYLVIPFSNKIIKDYLDDYENVYNDYAKIIASDDKRIKTLPLGS